MSQAIANSTGVRPQPLWQEASASVADMGTFLPLAVGVSITCGLNFGLVLLCAGLANIHSGWRFGLPIPVQPMKALAAVAIASSWGAGDLTLSGLFMGLAMVALSITGVAQWVSRSMPASAVRGIQLAAALLLATKAIRWLAAAPVVPTPNAYHFDSLLLAGLALVVMYYPRLPRGWSVLAVFASGLLLSIAAPSFAPQIATPAYLSSDWSVAAKGALIQLPLTLLNSVIAVCALSGELFPGRGVPPKRMALNVGLINLFSSIAGGMPMCHGSGGLAAVHRCGGRSGLAPICLGLAMLLCGLLMSQASLAIVQRFPKSLLAAMLIVTSASLAQTALKPIIRNWRGLAAAGGVAALLALIQI